MTALDILNFPALQTVLRAAANLLNSVYLPAATPGSIAAGLLVVFVAVPVLLVLRWLASRKAGIALAGRVADLRTRLEVTELLLADAAGETSQLRERVEQLMSRQEALTATSARGGLRQAIALSKHGATTRHLIDTCGLSQGEAHLVQTLYGRAPGIDQPEELH